MIGERVFVFLSWVSQVEEGCVSDGGVTFGSNVLGTKERVCRV